MHLVYKKTTLAIHQAVVPNVQPVGRIFWPVTGCHLTRTVRDKKTDKNFEGLFHLSTTNLQQDIQKFVATSAITLTKPKPNVTVFVMFMCCSMNSTLIMAFYICLSAEFFINSAHTSELFWPALPL